MEVVPVSFGVVPQGTLVAAATFVVLLIRDALTGRQDVLGDLVVGIVVGAVTVLVGIAVTLILVRRSRAFTTAPVGVGATSRETPAASGAGTGGSTDAYSHFTEEARRTLTLAQDEAAALDHNYIGTEHLLLGLLRQPESVAGRVLRNLGVEFDKAQRAIGFIVGRGEKPVAGEVGLTPRSKRVLEFAVHQARRFDRQDIGTEHLLLAIVREGEGIAAQVLQSFGVTLEKAQAEVFRVLEDDASA